MLELAYYDLELDKRAYTNLLTHGICLFKKLKTGQHRKLNIKTDEERLTKRLFFYKQTHNTDYTKKNVYIALSKPELEQKKLCLFEQQTFVVEPLLAGKIKVDDQDYNIWFVMTGDILKMIHSQVARKNKIKVQKCFNLY